MESTEKALVLKVGRFREVDAWVRLFSPAKGVFNAFAFGGSVSRRRFMGCLDPFNVVAFKVKTDAVKGYSHLLEGSLLTSHSRLRQDQHRLGMAVNCVKFLEAAHLGPSGSAGAFSLLLETLAALDAPEEPAPSMPLFYRARAAFDQGFRPDFRACARCGADLRHGAAAWFLVEQGKLYCGECRRFGKGLVTVLGAESLEVLRAVAERSPAGWAAMRPPSQTRMECNRALDLFVTRHVGLTWDHGSFRRI